MNSFFIKIQTNVLFQALSYVILSASFVGCGAASQLVDPTPGTFGSVYTKTLKAGNCVQCHDGSNSAEYGNLNFSTQALAYQTLTQGTVTGPVAKGNCGGLKLINANSPTTSYFTAVLFDEYATQSGFAGDSDCAPYATHRSEQNISADEKTSIIDWINAGAPNN